MGGSSDNGDIDCNDRPAGTTTTLAADVAADDASSPPMKKKKHKKRKSSKGRLKKLWRRATVGSPPGITSRSEWLELMDLHSGWKDVSHADADSNEKNAGCKQNDQQVAGGGVATDNEAMSGPLPGPSVSLASTQQQQQQPRDFSQLENWQTTEGSDHRDVLVNLLFGEGGGNDSDAPPKKKKKKRKLGPNNSTKEEDNGKTTHHSSSSLINVPPMPSWSSIGNLGSVGGVAVIEVEISGAESDKLMPSQRIVDSMGAKSTTSIWSSLLQTNSDNNEVKRTISAACKVQLFQGNASQPRCLSDVLMFLPPPPAEADGATQNNGCFDLLRAMNDLLLKPKQLRSEGFPIETIMTTIDPKLAWERLCKMSGTIPTDEHDALELVSDLSVNAVLGDTIHENGADKKDDFSKMEHYVKSLSHRHFATDDTSSSLARDSTGEEAQPTSQKRKIFALDCEMVKTPAGPELARVSVIMFTGSNSENGNNDTTKAEEEEKSVVVLDELVKPRRKVLDYLTGNGLLSFYHDVLTDETAAIDTSDTHIIYIFLFPLCFVEYSGITPKMLQDVETRIEHIQVRLLSIIDENDILIGHSLENDLRALRLVHTKVIDTSVVFRGSNGRKLGLRHLANVLLQKKIQQGCGSSGHCSTEDASAALILALRRARRGDSFRMRENSRRENILGVFQTINRASKNKQSKDDGESSFAERNDGPCVCIGPNDDWITKYAQSADGAHHVLSCDSIMNSMSMAVPSWLSSDKSSKRAGFLWANLRCEAKTSNARGNEVKKIDELLVSYPWV